MTESASPKRLASTIETLLEDRRPDATICPSDAARTVGGEEWRELMTAVRSIAENLHDQGVVEIRQHGKRVDPRTVTGPIRIGRGPKWPSGT